MANKEDIKLINKEIRKYKLQKFKNKYHFAGKIALAGFNFTTANIVANKLVENMPNDISRLSVYVPFNALALTTFLLFSVLSDMKRQTEISSCDLETLENLKEYKKFLMSKKNESSNLKEKDFQLKLNIK